MASKELHEPSLHIEPVHDCRSRMKWKDHVNMYHLVNHTSVDDYTMYDEDVYMYVYTYILWMYAYVYVVHTHEWRTILTCPLSFILCKLKKKRKKLLHHHWIYSIKLYKSKSYGHRQTDGQMRNQDKDTSCYICHAIK